MEQRPIDRIVPVLLLLLVLATGVLLYKRAQQLNERKKEITALTLVRTQQMARVRLEAMFNEWSEDLVEEANAAALAYDTVVNPVLIDRWKALLASHWSIRSIRLGDESGNETALYRADRTCYLVRTWHGSLDRQARAWNVDLPITDSTAVTWPTYDGYDPRERIWFSKALENDRDMPVWCIRQFGDTASNILQVSTLIRGRDTGDAYRVMVFDIDLSHSEGLDASASYRDDHGFLLLSGDGQALSASFSADMINAKALFERVHEEWATDPGARSYTILDGTKRYAVRTEVFSLNGLALHTAVILNEAPLNNWLEPEFRAVLVGTVLLAVLTVLLAILWWRGMVQRRQVRKQERQTQNQARKLDKVIGEREVLSREVHHRVKNNLQVVSSLLNLQASSLDNGPVRDEFLRGKRRIDTMALVHHKLYDLADLRNIDLHVLFTQLVDALAQLHLPQSRTVSIAVHTNGLKCDQDTAIELGIVLCELVANAYQHAFPYATGGHVEVVASHVEGDLHRMVVSNNGVPLPEGSSSGPGKLGLEIVDALAGQLDGGFHIRSTGGVAFEVLFRMRRPTLAELTAVDPESGQ